MTPTPTPVPTATPIPTNTPVPTLSPEEYEAAYKAQVTTPDVRGLTRSTEAYVGEIVTYSGTVLQVLESHL